METHISPKQPRWPSQEPVVRAPGSLFPTTMAVSIEGGFVGGEKMDGLTGMIASRSFLGCFAADRLHNSCRLQQCEATKDEWVSATSSSACVGKPGDRTGDPGIRNLFAELRRLGLGVPPRRERNPAESLDVQRPSTREFRGYVERRGLWLGQLTTATASLKATIWRQTRGACSGTRCVGQKVAKGR